MEEPGFTNLLAVVLIAFAVPLALGLVPALRVPSVVVELVAGIVVGPAVLGWVEVDEAVEVLAVLGLAFLLFLAGLEIEVQRLRGRVLRVSLLAFAVSFGVGLLAGLALDAAGVVGEPLFVAIVLTATSLGVVVPVLKDAGEVDSTFGQLVIAASSIADFATVILLSLLFAEESASATTQVLLVAALFAVVVLVTLAVRGVEHLGRVRAALQRLQDTTAQIRVRGAVLLLVGLVALAAELGLEVILGAFLAGAVLTLVDRDEAMTHPALRRKLEAIGYGVFVPVFFVTSGLTYDLDALVDGGALAYVPLFLAALLAVRGLPALLYRPLVPTDRVVVAALLQATSLPFVVASTAIGRELGIIDAGDAAALIAAGLLSVLVFPAAALAVLRRDPGMRARLRAAGPAAGPTLGIGRGPG